MKITIVSMLSGSFDPYWRDVELGVQSAKKNFSVDVEFLVPPGIGATEREITEWQIATLSEIARKRDTAAVAAAMLNYSKAPDAIRRVAVTGIPVVTFDTDAPESKRSFFIGTNNYTAGSTVGFHMAKRVEFKGDIAIDAPSLTVQSCMERLRGFKEVIARYKDIRIAREVGGDESHRTMEAQAMETIRSVKDLKGIFCVSGTSAKINAAALKRAGLQKKVKILCFDADREIISLIRDGTIDSTIAQRPYTMGFRLVDYLYQIATLGMESVMKSVPKSRIVDTGIHNVTADNIDSYRDSLKRLGIPVDF